MKFLFIAICTIIISCNNAVNNTIADSLPTSKAEGVTIDKNEGNITKTDISTSDTNSSIQNDSTILIKFQKDSSSAIVKAKMREINSPIIVYIPVKHGKEIIAKITPEGSAANIRFSQVFMPNGKADGPFSQDMKYPINQQGTYKLIINENLMQGDEWKGNFKLTVTVK